MKVRTDHYVWTRYIRKNILHYLLDECDITTSEDAMKLVEEYKALKKAAEVTNLSQAEGNDTKLSANFAGVLRNINCADGGSDIDLLDKGTMVQLTARVAAMKVTKFHNPQRFRLGTVIDLMNQQLFIECNKVATVTVELAMLHRKSLRLRNIA